MTSNEISLILKQIETSTESLATGAQFSELDTKFDGHIREHKRVAAKLWKMWLVIFSALVAAGVPAIAGLFG